MSPDTEAGHRQVIGVGRTIPRRTAAVDTGMSRHRTGVALFLIAALASFLLSIALWFTDHREEGVFVGLWVPSILAAGAFWIAAVRVR
jgi:hypothetical protein